jgi:beta-xylosidase
MAGVGCSTPPDVRMPSQAMPVVAEPPVRESSFDGDFADPHVFRGADAYYAVATGAGQLAHVQVARSEDLAKWTLLGEALPELPSWASSEEGVTWAPSALARRDGYVLYYTTREKSSGFQCISRAFSRFPDGPYVDDSSRPLVCQVGRDGGLCGSIDPSPFVDFDQAPYLLWKSDENSSRCRTAPRIWAQPLSDDGLDLVGTPQLLLAADQRWEDIVVEAPSMILHDGRYLLFYSGNRYDSSEYAIGYATCPRLAGLCTKATLAAPYLASDDSMLGPGGQELFRDVSGSVWMAYHAWTAPETNYEAGGARTLRIARLSFGPSGEPRKLTAR